MTTPPAWLGLGDRAPDFVLPVGNREGQVGLADYRGRSPLMLGLFRGLYCPYCRRHVARFGAARDQLDELGVEMLGVVISSPEHARMYFRHRPTRLLMAADDRATTHRAYRVPATELTPPEDARVAQWPYRFPRDEFAQVRIDPAGELDAPMPPPQIQTLLNRRDGFEMTAEDVETRTAHATQREGYFLIDPGGVIRWSRLDAMSGPEELGRCPTEADLVAAARAVSR